MLSFTLKNRTHFRRWGGLLVLLTVLGSPAVAQNLSRSTSVEERRAIATRWHRLVNRFGAIPSNAKEIDLKIMGESAYKFHLQLGENADGVIRDPDSSSNFFSGNFYPRLMAAYCFWRVATSPSDHNQVVELLEPLIDQSRYEKYQLPCVLALYLDSALQRREPQLDLDAISAAPTKQEYPADPELLSRLERLWQGFHRYQKLPLDRPIWSLRKVPKKQTRATGQTAEMTERKVFDLHPERELPWLLQGERGVPFPLAQRLLYAEAEALENIVRHLQQHPFREEQWDISGLVATEKNPLPYAAGTINYPLPIVVEAVTTRQESGETQVVPLGTLAPSVTHQFHLPLDRLLPGFQATTQYRWRLTPQGAFLKTFLGLSQMEGVYTPAQGQQAHFEYTSHFPADRVVEHIRRKKALLTYQTDLPNDAMRLESEQVALKVTLTSANAAQVAWSLVDAKGTTFLPETVQRVVKNSVTLTLPTATLPLGDYRLQIRLTDQENPSADDWVSPPAPSAATGGPATLGFSVVSRNVAFIVGVNAYKANSLNFAVNDAVAFEEALVSRFGYDRRNIVRLLGRSETQGGRVDAGPLALPNENFLSKATFRQAFSHFLRLVKNRRAQHIVLFFSGHGLYYNGKDQLQMGNLEMVPTQELLQEMASVLDDGKPHTIIGFYDACRNEVDKSEGQSFGQERFAPPYSALRYAGLLSCKQGEVSNENRLGLNAVKYEGVAFQHGFFTFALLEAMKEVPLKTDLDFQRLHAQAQKTLKKLNEQALPKGELRPGEYTQQSLPTLKQLDIWERVPAVIGVQSQRRRPR